MICRAETIEVIEKTVDLLGLSEVVAAHLTAAYDAQSLADLSDEDLKRAFRFITLIQGCAPVGQLMPFRPGMQLEGEMCWFRGRLTWETGHPSG